MVTGLIRLLCRDVANPTCAGHLLSGVGRPAFEGETGIEQLSIAKTHLVQDGLVLFWGKGRVSRQGASSKGPSALDPEVIVEVTNVIRKLVSEHNLTMLMVTHQMGFARDISDRVCFFYDG